MSNQKLLPPPAMFDFSLNQTSIDLSRNKLSLVEQETELIKQLSSLNRELESIKSQIKSLEFHNQNSLMIFNISRRRIYG